jgi:SPP1 Gp6-like portal protein
VLIDPGTQWPPPGHWTLRTRWQAWRALWSGDPHQLKQHMRHVAPNGYWQRRNDKPGGREMHLPVASDIARTAGELVAGDTPAMEWTNPNETKAWDLLSQELGWSNSLIEAAETAAAVGGAFLRPAWDVDIADHALSTVVAADEALPTFRFGQLQSVTFVEHLSAPAGWKATRDGEVWRHLEHHEPGQIRHELWLGDTGEVGRPIPLADHPDTAFFEPVIDTTSIRPRGILVEYFPNDLPNPLSHLPVGRSDFQGIETELDAIDEVWDSWMRDIRLAKARLLVPDEYLSPVSAKTGVVRSLFNFGRGNAAKEFDEDAEVFRPINMDIGTAEHPTKIEAVQFQIRAAEHAATIEALLEQAVARAGYSPQTMGMNVDGQLSGTAMRRREQRSYRTQGRKRRYMRPAVERYAETLMLINASVFSTPKPTARPELAWRETDQADPVETANVIKTLRDAQALSTEIAVRAQHPEWDDAQVAEEVARIKDDQPAPVLTGFEHDPPHDPNDTSDPAAPGFIVPPGVPKPKPPTPPGA